MGVLRRLFGGPAPKGTTADNAEERAYQERQALQKLVDRIDKASARLPREAYASFSRIKVVLRACLDRAPQLAASQDNLHVVSRTIRDYLPTALETYLDLPRQYAEQVDVQGRGTPAQQLVDQLHLLEERLEQVKQALYVGDANALANHGRFLEEKFHASGLEPPDRV